jgi:hypothetical protein
MGSEEEEEEEEEEEKGRSLNAVPGQHSPINVLSLQPR